MEVQDQNFLPAGQPSVHEVFWAFLRLGVTSFGGPVAHLGYFRSEFVVHRRWLSERDYADILGLCQFLPGPTSSQVGMALGLSRAGYGGALAAWVGFTLPSAVALILFALGLPHLDSVLRGDALHGLKVVAVAVVAQALWQMGKNFCPDRLRVTMAGAAAVAVILSPTAWGQVGTIAMGACLGILLLNDMQPLPPSRLKSGISWRMGAFFLVLFFGLLLLLPLLGAATHNHVILLMDSFYRAGALVFGGGHVVLPLLQAAVVHPGWVSNDVFLAGYGAAQAIPGPLFTFAAYLGAVARPPAPSGWWGGFIGLVAIFLPAFLLVFGVMPYWERIRHFHGTQCAMRGVNAAVVGILLAAFYHPVWTSAMVLPIDFCLAVTAFLLLEFWKQPAWLVVLLCAVAGFVMPNLGVLKSFS